MAQYYGGVSIPHATYEQFKAATLSNSYDYDGYYHNQCWDFVQELYYQYGLVLYTKPGGGGAADCWLVSRYQNALSPFILVNGKENIKKGDVLVFKAHGAYYTGHIALANENYKGGSTIQIVGQNQGQGSGPGAGSNIINYNISYFIGGFRNVKWQTTPPPTPPTPTPTKKKGGFPWAVFTRKIRKR